jgi:hypothetical protein
MVAQVRYSVAGWSRGRVAPCAACTWHVETRSAGFLVEPQNQGHVVAPELPQAGQRELEPQVTWRHRSCPGLGSGSWSRRSRGGTEAVSGWAVGAGATGHVAAPELSRAGQRELEPQDTWRHQSSPGLGSGSWSRRTRGGPGADPCWAAGAGAAGHVVAPELLQRVPSGFRQFGLKTGGNGFSRFALKTGGRVSWLSLKNQGGGGFHGLGLKIGSSGLVIWASKSPRRFLGLGLKTKWALGCRLRHKTDGGRSARDTRRNLAAYLASKQV